MIKKILPMYFLLIFSFINVPTFSYAQFRVVGYLPTWWDPASVISSVDLAKFTHINIAFANPNSSGVLVPADGVTGANVNTVVSTCHNAGVKVFLSMGGAGASASRYSTLLGSAANRTSFVTNIVSYTTTHNLDGIDVDIEGDVLDGTNVTKSQYQSFVTELVDSLHKHNKLMSAALATWFGSYVSTTAAAQFDWINIMSYDAYGPWSGPGDHSPYSLATSDFNYWNSTKGVAAANLNIGVPFYGYGWGSYQPASNDEIGYCDIVNTYTNGERVDAQGTTASGNYLSYNGLPTIIKKTNYALSNAGGVMIWEIMEDCSTSDPRSLLRAIDSLVHPQMVTAVSNRQLAQDKMNIFPNPASSHLEVQLNLSAEANGSLVLCDMNGHVLKQLANGSLNAQALYPVSLDEYSNGMYLIKLVADDGILIKKVVKY